MSGRFFIFKEESMSKVIFSFLAAIFFLVYFDIYRIIYNSLGLYSTVSQLISGLILVVVIIPLALISSRGFIAFIKNK